MTVFWGKNGKYYLKAGQSEGSVTAPSQITTDGRADRLGILSKKWPLKKGGLIRKEQNERKMASLS